MSIQTEIDRIKNAKADIISALNAKGIAVPEDTAIENIASYILNVTYTLRCGGNLNNFSQTYGPAYGPTICGRIGNTNTGFILYDGSGTSGTCNLYYSTDLENKTANICIYFLGGTASSDWQFMPTTIGGPITWDLDAFASEYFTNITLADLNAAFIVEIAN